MNCSIKGLGEKVHWVISPRDVVNVDEAIVHSVTYEVCLYVDVFHA
jgi:hypothetical protein